MTITRNECPACGSVHVGEPRVVPGGQWESCAGCGLLYERVISPYHYVVECWEADGACKKATFDPSESKIARYITGDYGTCPKEQWRVRLNQASKHVVDRSMGLLEVGFGGGEILEYAREAGWPTVWGIEVMEDYVLFARSRGFDAVRADLTRQLPLLSSASLVMANEVMEHVVDPLAFLRNASLYLCTNSILWASFGRVDLVPDPDPDEWHWWTEASVRAIVDRAGLDVVEIEPSPFAWLASMKRRG